MIPRSGTSPEAATPTSSDPSSKPKIGLLLGFFIIGTLVFLVSAVSFLRVRKHLTGGQQVAYLSPVRYTAEAELNL